MSVNRILVGLTCFGLGLNASCMDTEEIAEEVKLGDGQSYTEHVQPYLGYGCASLDCHGDLGRRFRLYAELGLRRSVELRGEAISSEEIDDNLLSIAFTLESDDRGADLLLSKGLAIDAGGMAHEGGDIWRSRDEPGYRCLSLWLNSTPSSQLTTPCAEAYEEVKPLPPSK